MAGIIDERQDNRESTYEPETDVIEEETDDIDNDESFDLDGNLDEDVDTDDETDDTNGDDEEDSEFEEGDELDEPDEESDEETNEGNDEQKPAEESQDDGKDARIKELEQQLAAERASKTKFKAQTKETLEKLGVKVEGDVEEALDLAAAETEGITLEEYRAKKKAAEEAESAKQALKRQKFEELTASDLAELKKSFPDLVDVGNIRDCFSSFDDFAQFGRLRDSGVTPKNAYMAVNGEKVRSAQAVAAQKKVESDGKRHITSVAPKKASDNSVVMPKEVLREWRDMFPDKTDKELRALYRQTL